MRDSTKGPVMGTEQDRRGRRRSPAVLAFGRAGGRALEGRIFASLAAAAVSLMVLGATPLAAQGGKPAVSVKADVRGQATPSEPCCTITAIEAGSGLVTARDLESGRTFRFRLSDATLLGRLKVGQNLSADFTAQTVRIPIHGAEPIAGIILRDGGLESTAQEINQGGGGRQPVLDRRIQAAVRAAYTGPRSGEGPAKETCQGKWECTTINTGSNPGPEDDLISCHCIPDQPTGGSGGAPTVQSSSARTAGEAGAGGRKAVRPPNAARFVPGSRVVRASGTVGGRRAQVAVTVTPAGGVVRAVASGAAAEESRSWNDFWGALVKKINDCKRKYPNDEAKRTKCIDDAIVETVGEWLEGDL